MGSMTKAETTAVSDDLNRPIGPISIPERHTDWLRDARCAEPGVDPEWFYLDAPNEKERRRVHEQALRFCRQCPVMMECRIDGDQREGEGAYVYGVLGGETPRDRRRRRAGFGRLDSFRGGA